MKRLFTTALLVLLVTASAASANSKSWTAVRGMLPDHVNVVVGANLSTLRGTSLYQQFIPPLIAKQGDAQQAFDLAKSTCAIDLHAAIVDATVAMGDDERGLVALALDRTIDQKRVVGCFDKLLAAQAKQLDAKANDANGGLRAGAKPSKQATKPRKVVVKTTGRITEYSVPGEDSKLYVAWLAKDVVAFATDSDDRALLEKMLGGKGVRGVISTLLAKVSSKAAVWLATTKSTPIQTGGTMKGAYGTVEAAKGQVELDMSLVLGSPKEAKKFVDDTTAVLASAKGSIPPQFAKLFDALVLSANADAANMRLSASEQDLAGLISLAMMNL